MPDAPAAAPASNAAPPAAPPAAVTPSSPVAEGTKSPETQHPAQELQKAVEPPADDAARRAERLARAKREASRVQAKAEDLARREAQFAEDRRLAAEYRRFDELRLKDPQAYLEEIAKGDPRFRMGELSRSYLERTTGAGKNPQQLVDEAVEKRMAAMAKERQQLDEKTAQENQVKQREATYAGIRNSMAQIIAGDAEKYELCNIYGGTAPDSQPVQMAWQIIEKQWAKTQTVPPLANVVAAVELSLEQLHLTAGTKSKKVMTGLEKLRAEATEAAKKLAEAEKAASGSKGAPKAAVGAEAKTTTEQSSPKPQPPLRRMMPRDQKRIARELALAHAASKDT